MITPRAASIPGRHTCRTRGFTLIELMFVLTIAALLFAIGVPTFRNAALGSQLSAAANNLLASIQLARSEAIKRNLPVTVCASSDGATCTGGGWEQGWIVVDSGAIVIQRQAGLPAGYQMTQDGGTTDIEFQPIGIGATPASITVCRDDPLGSQERVLSVRAAGFSRVTTTYDGVCPD